MRTYTYLVPAFFSLGLSEATTLLPRGWKFKDNSGCDQAKQDIVKDEIGRAHELVDLAKANLREGVYYDTFFAEALRNDDAFEGNVIKVYERIGAMLDGSIHDYDFDITCDNTTPMCSKKNSNYFAHMNDGNKLMNFCDRFFSPNEGIKPTQERKDNCGTISLREAQHSRSAVIVHECTHTRYAMESVATADHKLAKDFAYGFNGNFKLPLNTWDRSCQNPKNIKPILCPKSDNPDEEGVCDPLFTAVNADTYSFVAAGVGFTKWCQNPIPLPPPPSARKRALQKRACPADDSIPFDDGPDDGESASGTGTCKLDITEVWTCEHPEQNLYARMTIRGSDGNVLYNTGRGTSAPGVQIGDLQRPVIQEDGMAKGLQVIGQHVNDYIQFYYGDLAWTTGTTEGPATCKIVGDNWATDWPFECNAGARTRQFECQYPCSGTA